MSQVGQSLHTVPFEPYVLMGTIGRRVSRDGYISYNGNEYSMSEGWGVLTTDAGHPR